MTLPSYATLLTEMVEPHVLLITLNRPEVGNALNTQMGRDFLDLWTRLTEDAGRRALRRAHRRRRSHLLRRRRPEGAQRHDQRAVACASTSCSSGMYWTLTDLPVPVIAAVNGHAYARRLRDGAVVRLRLRRRARRASR